MEFNVLSETRALVTGATGFIGGRLTRRLLSDGARVRCLVRDRRRAEDLSGLGAELHEGDVLDPSSLAGAGEGVDVAYYLIHSMGRGGDGDFSQRERVAARAFADMAQNEGIERIVYLGGLGDSVTSKHLRARHETATILAQHGPPLTYFRAAMVVGSGSESYRTLRYLVERLPVMIAPAWLSTETQPIGLEDVLAYLALAPQVEESKGREVQIGGPDVMTYADMLDSMADALGKRRRPRLNVPSPDSPPVVALDRTGHAGGRRRCAPADRGAADADRGRRPDLRGALPGDTAVVRRGAAGGAGRREGLASRPARSSAAATAAVRSAETPATAAVACAEPSGSPSRSATVEAMSVRSPPKLAASHGSAESPARTARSAPECSSTSRAPRARRATRPPARSAASPSHLRVSRSGAAINAAPYTTRSDTTATAEARAACISAPEPPRWPCRAAAPR